MTPRQDPYRVLGLVPGATAGEIRSAYRRLAKLNHPDTAGERSLPRFLAIKAAYEELVDGEGRLRSLGWPGRNGGAGSSRPSGAPANRASREAWRARRTGGSAAGSAGAEGAAGEASARSGGPSDPKRDPASKARPRAGAGPSAGPGAKAREGSTGGPNPGPRGRPKSADRRTARPGSTTYDEAAQPLDPSWEGGSWYGASSGRYWTLNPREYADPRKHGPEYQERAKRAAQLEAARRAGTPMPVDGEMSEAPPSTSAKSTSAPSTSAPASSSGDANPVLPPRQRRAVRRPAGTGGP